MDVMTVTEIMVAIIAASLLLRWLEQAAGWEHRPVIGR
jgi:hypothetical protein